MNNENKVHCKTTYKCGICGKAHDDVLSRAKCEIACAEKKAEEERKAAERKKAAEYEARKKEVDAALDHAYELRDKFLKDYDCYTYNQTVGEIRAPYFPFSWLWEH